MLFGLSIGLLVFFPLMAIGFLVNAKKWATPKHSATKYRIWGVVFVIISIIFIFIAINTFSSDSSDSDYHSNYDSTTDYDDNDDEGGFIGSDGEYHNYVPEFGDDVNNWMKENW